MKYEMISQAVRIIKDKVLTPVIYMSDHGDWAEFICFCDGRTTMQDLYDTEQEVRDLLDTDVEIIDIREFSEAERLDIIGQCELIYSEHQIIEKIFEASMITDYQRMINEKNNMLQRQRESGTFYIQ